MINITNWYHYNIHYINKIISRVGHKGMVRDTGWTTDTSSSMKPSPPSGPLTHARAKALREKVTSLLSTFHLGTPLDGMHSRRIHYVLLGTSLKKRLRGVQPARRREDVRRRRQQHQRRAVLPLITKRYYRWPVLPGSRKTSRAPPKKVREKLRARAVLPLTDATALPPKRYYRPSKSGITARSSGTTATAGHLK